MFLKLLEVKEWAKAEGPHERKDFDGKEIGVSDLADFFEYFESGHHDRGLFGFHALEEGYNFFLHSIFV